MNLTEQVAQALAEDLGLAGDITSAATIPADHTSQYLLRAREPGVISGIEYLVATYRRLDESVKVEVHTPDGTPVQPGSLVATISGPTRSILTGERVALNFLGHLSGVATATAQLAQAISHTGAQVVCTRKTIPGLRAAQKAAVRHGGGANHRFGLFDAVLIKDNHIAAAGGVNAAVAAARANVGHLVKIEVEVDTLDQLRELLADPVDVVLLDNMPPEILRQAVELVDGRMVTEASGGITPATIVAVAEAGVDLISVGWLTHSARVLDLGLDAA